MVAIEQDGRSLRPEMDALFLQACGEGTHQHRRSSGKSHGARFLPEAGEALWRTVGQAFDQHVALVVLREGGEPELRHRHRHGRVHPGPEPGGAQVEPFLDGPPAGTGGKDAATEPVARLEDAEADARLLQQPRRMQPCEASADDGNGKDHLSRPRRQGGRGGRSPVPRWPGRAARRTPIAPCSSHGR